MCCLITVLFRESALEAQAAQKIPPRLASQFYPTSSALCDCLSLLKMLCLVSLQWSVRSSSSS